jgi:hypothetical protein
VLNFDSLPNVSTNIALAIIRVNIFICWSVLAAVYSRAGSWRGVGCDGSDWWSGREGCCEIREEHMVEERGDEKFFKVHMVRRGGSPYEGWVLREEVIK